jgi:hypothetical protein
MLISSPHSESERRGARRRTSGETDELPIRDQEPRIPNAARQGSLGKNPFEEPAVFLFPFVQLLLAVDRGSLLPKFHQGGP